jgi:hypothetical protein
MQEQAHRAGPAWRLDDCATGWFRDACFQHVVDIAEIPVIE